VSAALFCTDCKSLLCDAHVTLHRKSRATHAHTLLATSERSSPAFSSGVLKARCAVHGDQWISFFCKEHDVAVCDRCGILNHNRCTLVDIGDAALLSAQRLQLEKMVESAGAGVELAEKLSSTLKRCRGLHVAAIDSFVSDLHKRVDDARDKLLKDYGDVMSALVSKVDAVSNTVPLMVHEVKELLHTQQLPQLLARKPQLTAALPVDVRTIFHSDLDRAIGTVQAVPGLALNITTGDWMRSLEIGWGAVRCFHGLFANRFHHTTWGALGANRGQLNSPSGIAVDRGLIYVADTGNNRVCIFNRHRQPLRIFPVLSTMTLMEPTGIAISDGLVYVTDSGNDRVCVFHRNGDFLRSWKTSCSFIRGDQPLRPWGIAVCNDLAYVTDAENNRLRIYKIDGTFVRSITSCGDMAFNRPLGVAVSNGSVFVVDSGNHRICVFLADGTFVWCWGSKGDARGQFLSPSGVAVCNQLVHVTDRERQRITSFMTNGKLVDVCGASHADRFDFTDIAVAEDVRYVTNQLHHSVTVFEPDRGADK